MANYELKKFVIENGLYNKYAMARHNSYLASIGEPTKGETIPDFECFLAREYGENWWQISNECVRIGNSSNQRIKRLKERVKVLLSKGQCLFLTLTFNDSVLNSTDTKQRRGLVMAYLKSMSSDFIANIDFGKVSEREHYHAIIQCEKVDYTLWHENGAIKGEKVRLKGKCGGNIAKYIDKLSLHALKESTYRNRMLYSQSVIEL